jgi:hypothetical protein
MDNSMSKILIAGAALLVLVFGVVIIGAFLLVGSVSKSVHAQAPSVSTAPAVQSVVSNEPITINKIISTPVVYKNLQLTLDGKVVTWVTKNAFTVSEEGEKNSSKKLLVISSQKFGQPANVPATDVAIGESVNVTFTGTAGILKIQDKDTNFGDEDEVRELRRFNDNPVIFATSVVQK